MKHLILLSVLFVSTFSFAKTYVEDHYVRGPVYVLNQNELRLRETDANGANYTGFKSAASVASNVIWTLPVADGITGDCLQTDGSGVLDWSTCGGGGGKNYFTSNDAKFEGNSVGNWTDAGSGSATLTESITSTSTEILEGSYSLELDKSAADGSGQYWSVTIGDIDRGDLIRGNLTGSFEYDLSQDSDYATSDLVVQVYDTDAADDIYCTANGTGDQGLELFASKGVFNFNCAVDENTGSLDFRIAVNSTNAAQYSGFFDNFKFGPSAQTTVPVITNEQDFTPTGSWTGNVTYTGKYRRIGGSAEIQYKLTMTGAPTPGATNLEVDLPSGLTIDTDRLLSAVSGKFLNIDSVVTARDDSTSSRPSGRVNYSDSNSVFVGFYTDISSSESVGAFTDTAPFTFASGDTIDITMTLPISGWSAGAVLNENELGQKTVRVSARASNNTSLTANTTPIDFTETDDSHNAWSSNNTFTAPMTGYYEIKGSIRLNGSASPSYYSYIKPVGGSYTIDKLVGFNAASTTTVRIGWTGKLNKGEALQIRSDTNTTLLTSDNLHWIEISSRPDYTTLGVVKNYEYVTDNFTTGTTASADTYVDTDASITVGPGTWKIGLKGSIYLLRVSTDTFVYGNAVIRDGSSNVIANTASTAGALLSSTFTAVVFPVSSETIVTVSEETTYKISLRSNVASSVATVTMVGESFTGALSNPDGSSFIYADRVK